MKYFLFEIIFLLLIVPVRLQSSTGNNVTTADILSGSTFASLTPCFGGSPQFDDCWTNLTSCKLADVSCFCGSDTKIINTCFNIALVTQDLPQCNNNTLASLITTFSNDTAAQCQKAGFSVDTSAGYSITASGLKSLIFCAMLYLFLA